MFCSLVQKEGLKCLFSFLKFIWEYGDIKFTDFCRMFLFLEITESKQYQHNEFKPLEQNHKCVNQKDTY